ncbi:YidC/Oxa1 family membrane protein insertase [Paenibacillus eucommiae]|uniref:YidC/Oxa1 family membrane protein insertase n=1 Tax=Paenibacillus eucommiae TaxID=1355755 RepID=A0ABS4IXH7_9BACL|nr:YidC/Oxa1 family membrane protein insertase [Paenibacillus eucommiae]MBP1992284.1 YidC/Oxa1 family membrane protein insertase [Paenibacillus eucommiae]
MLSWISPIISVLDSLLTFFFRLSHDWGAAIILLTLMVRSILFVFNLRMARQQVKQASVQPKLKQLREQFSGDMSRLSQETLKLYNQYGIKPFAMFTAGLLQMPVFMGMYGLFKSHGAAMSSLLLPWVSNLGQYDPWHIIPIVCSIFSFISYLVPLTNELIAMQSFNQRIGMSLLFAGIFLVVMWKSPVALALYWTTNSVFAILERIFYRTKLGRAMLLRGNHMEPSAA